MSYVFVAYSIVIIAILGFGFWEWQSLRSLEKQSRTKSRPRYET